MKKILYPIVAVLAFFIMQMLTSVAVCVVELVKHPEYLQQFRQTRNPDILNQAFMNDGTLAWALIISDILTIAIIALVGMIDWKQVLNVRQTNWKYGLMALFGAMLGIFWLNIMNEFLDLPDLMENEFINMSNSWIGALSIGVIGPIVEEFIFREGVLGSMLRSGMNKWVAITASALVFGIIHLNPAQIPTAATIGFIFGIIYYKTGNIVITSILHILNNSVAVWMMYSMGDAAKDASLVEWLGGAAMANGIAIPVLVVCIVTLRRFWVNYKV